MLKLHETVSRNVIRDLCTVEPHNNSVVYSWTACATSLGYYKEPLILILVDYQIEHSLKLTVF